MNYEQKYKKYKLKYLYALQGGATEAELKKSIGTKKGEIHNKDKTIDSQKRKIERLEKDLGEQNMNLTKLISEKENLLVELNRFESELTELKTAPASVTTSPKPKPKPASVPVPAPTVPTAPKPKPTVATATPAPGPAPAAVTEPGYAFAPRVAAIFKPDKETTLFPADLLVTRQNPPPGLI